MNLISMSLWGANELYVQGAIANARLAPTIYPGWQLRIYCCTDVPESDLLRRLGVDVRPVLPAVGHAGLFWRFLPAAERDVDHVIVRDADSRLNVREKAAVDAWIASGEPFHVMRDHPHHRHAPILGGMWGCRGGSIPSLPSRIARFENGAAKHSDTEFLRDEIWPLVKDRCLVHSSVPDPLGGVPFPAHPPFEGFVGQIVNPRDEARDVVALLMPSRHRPDAALATARSARDTAAAPDALRILVGVEPDDAASYRATFGAEAAWVHVLQSGGNYVRAIRELHRAVPAGIYGFSADDFAFESRAWDARIRNAVNDLPKRLGLVYADDGVQGERLATAPFLTAEWIDCVGDTLPGGYTHMFCDTEVTDIARRAGLLHFLPGVSIRHRHYLVGDAAIDATYERASTTMAPGAAEFKAREGERERLAARLIAASHAPALSLLIAGLTGPDRSFDAWLAGVRQQIAALPDPAVVEILVEADAGERHAETKHRSLLAGAQGQWVALMDDADVVAQDAVAAILQALEQNPDVVSVAASRRMIAVRRSIALAVARNDRTGGDVRSSAAMSAIFTRTIVIDRPIIDRPGDAPRTNGRAASSLSSVSASPPRVSRSTAGFPSLAQQLLLKTAFCPDASARRAWSEWAETFAAEKPDHASTRLFPLVWDRLSRLGVEGAEVTALKPAYWDSWAKSHRHAELAAEAVRRFENAGIPTLLLKGIALAWRHYDKPQLRPMGDIDLMVPTADAARARDLLTSAGWRPIEPAPESALQLLHGLGFEDRAGRALDLHWRALHENPRTMSDDGFWARAEPMEIAGASTRVLAPADQLLHVCVHGLRWAKVPAIQWVADVMAILHSTSSELDWDRLVAEARARQVVLQVRRSLEYVRRALDAPDLDVVCDRLHSMHCTVADRVDFRVRSSPPSAGRNLLFYWLDHHRLHADDSWQTRYLGFPGYLRRIWGLPSLTGVAGTAARKGARRLKRESPT